MKRSALRFHRMLIIPALAGGMLLAASQPLLAQGQPTERNAPASAQPTEDVDGAAARAKLNAEQAQAAQAQVNLNVSSREEYERKLNEFSNAKEMIVKDAAAAQLAYETEKLRREDEYQAAMDKWRADDAACRKGDHKRCGPQAASPE